MGSDTDVTDFPLCLCLLQTFIQPGTVPGPVALRDIVELVNVDIISLQQTKGSLQILSEFLRGFRM